jgi:hypothetical protein
VTISLAIKAVPFPDFGIDEVILAVVALLLATVYRPTFRAILAESRMESDQAGEASGLGSASDNPLTSK